MTELLNWGADVILWSQQFQQPVVYYPLRFLTWLGGTGYLVLVPLILFSVDYRLGLRIALLVAASLFLNTWLKELFALPRPFESYPDIVSDGEHGHSFPSGHAQLVVIYWGLLALYVQRLWFALLAGIIVLLTGYSRIYLGVHYPTDVLTGWLLGGATLWAWWRWRADLEAYLRDHGRLMQAACLAAAGAVTVLLALFLDSLMLAGCIGFALGAGAAAIVHPTAMSHAVSPALRVARFVLGMVLVLLMIAALQKLAPLLPLPRALGVGLLLAALGGWVVGGVPTILDTLTAILVHYREQRANR